MQNWLKIALWNNEMSTVSWNSSVINYTGLNTENDILEKEYK